MALDEVGKDYLNKVLTGVDGVLAAGASLAPGNLSNLYITSHSVVMNSTKNYVGGSNSIDLNENLLIEASKYYAHSDGNKELKVEIQLATDVRDTQVAIEDIPDFMVDESTRLLPEFQGLGLVYDEYLIISKVA